jgi:uncharacterized surface protein with fasciclin (FAS1) repeats
MFFLVLFFLCFANVYGIKMRAYTPPDTPEVNYDHYDVLSNPEHNYYTSTQFSSLNVIPTLPIITPPKQGEATIIQTLESLQHENVMRQALILTNYSEILDTIGTMQTLFAPTDKSFEYLPQSIYLYLMGQSDFWDLKRVLQAHIIDREIPNDTFRNRLVLTSIDGTRHEIHFVHSDLDNNIMQGHFIIDGVRILDSYKTLNGYVHLIDGILSSHLLVIPPLKNLDASFQNCSSLSLVKKDLAMCVRNNTKYS